MAALGLRRWLARLKHRSNKGSAQVASEGPTANSERRLKRWYHRPLLEQLEDRVAVGSLLVRPIVPDGYWVFDGIDTPALALNAIEPSVKAASPAAPALEIVSLAPPASGQGTSVPPINR